MTHYDKIKKALKSMGTLEIITIHNAYCDATDNPDDYIYPMDDFDEIMSGKEPWEIARCCYYGEEFCPAHDFSGSMGTATWRVSISPPAREAAFILTISPITLTAQKTHWLTMILRRSSTGRNCNEQIQHLPL